MTSAYFIRWFINGFLAQKVSTTIETTTASLDLVHFPAVTVCNVNQISRSFLSALGIYEDLPLSLKFERQFIMGTKEDLSVVDLERVRQVLKSKEFVNMANNYVTGIRFKILKRLAVIIRFKRYQNYM